MSRILVVDDDVRSLRGEEQSVLSTDPPSGASDDGDPAFERTHRRNLVAPARTVKSAATSAT